MNLAGGGKQGLPSGVLGHPEDIVRGVLVAILEHLLALCLVSNVVGAIGVGQLGFKLSSAQREAVGHVLEKDEAEHEVLVLGRFDAAAELVRRLVECRCVRVLAVAFVGHDVRVLPLLFQPAGSRGRQTLPVKNALFM